MKLNKKFIGFGFLLITIAILLYYGGIYTEKQYVKNFEKFNQNNLNDTIINSDIRAKGVGLILERDTLIFYPKTSNLNDNNIFNYTAKKGDIVIKKPFQDTLTLKTKDGSIYKYTFMKP